MSREFDESADRAAAYFSEAREAVQRGDPRTAAEAYRSGRDAMHSAAGLKESVGDEIRYFQISGENFLAGDGVLNSLAGRIVDASRSAAERVDNYKLSLKAISSRPVSYDVSAPEAIEQRLRSMEEADERAKAMLTEVRSIIAHGLEDVKLATEISVILNEGIPRAGSAGSLYMNIDTAGRTMESLSRTVNQMISLVQGRDADQ